MKIKITRTQRGYQVHVFADGHAGDRAYAHVLKRERTTQAIENYGDNPMGVMVYCDDEPQVSWVDK